MTVVAILFAVIIAAAWVWPRSGELSDFNHRTSENKTNNVYRLPVGKQRVKRRSF